MDPLKMTAAFAIKPNELKRCGPEDAFRILFDFVAGHFYDEDKIRRILSQFEVFMPYYQLIATANRIDDVFDSRVVEAYWLGNGLLDNISPEAIKEVIECDVVKSGWNPLHVALLFKSIKLQKAKPHHSLSVMYFYARRGGSKALPLEIKERIDQCRACAGEVVGMSGDSIIVEYRPLVFESDGRISLAAAVSKEIDAGLIADVGVGEKIAFHLDWGVIRLSDEQYDNLEHYTVANLEAINNT